MNKWILTSATVEGPKMKIRKYGFNINNYKTNSAVLPWTPRFWHPIFTLMSTNLSKKNWPVNWSTWVRCGFRLWFISYSPASALSSFPPFSSATLSLNTATTKNGAGPDGLSAFCSTARSATKNSNAVSFSSAAVHTSCWRQLPVPCSFRPMSQSLLWASCLFPTPVPPSSAKLTAAAAFIKTNPLREPPHFCQRPPHYGYLQFHSAGNLRQHSGRLCRHLCGNVWR